MRTPNRVKGTKGPIRGQSLVGAGCGYLVDAQAFLFLLKKSGDAVNDLIQRSAGTEASKGMELFDRGHAAHHVLKAGFVGLVVGHVLNGGGAAGALLDFLGQCLDGDFLGVADVDDFADGALRVHEADEPLNGVAHIAEAARLLPGAVDADGGVVQGGLDEIGKDHSVATGLPGTNGIEQASHNDGQLLFLPVGESEKLIERLRSRVAPAALCGGAKDKVRVLDRKSTRLNSSHMSISYAVFCLKKKKQASIIIFKALYQSGAYLC